VQPPTLAVEVPVAITINKSYPARIVVLVRATETCVFDAVLRSTELVFSFVPEAGAVPEAVE
jgi:hypothetical protein